ncbi:hypothetical protein Tco_0308341 [Tanacetum coccineum]
MTNEISMAISLQYNLVEIQLSGSGIDIYRTRARLDEMNGKENIQRVENVGNVLVNGNQVGCSYKEFLACNLKEYVGKGGVVVLTRWIEKMEFV